MLSVRSSRPELICKKSVLTNFAKNSQKNTCASLFLIKSQASVLQLYWKRNCGTDGNIGRLWFKRCWLKQITWLEKTFWLEKIKKLVSLKTFSFSSNYAIFDIYFGLFCWFWLFLSNNGKKPAYNETLQWILRTTTLNENS